MFSKPNEIKKVDKPVIIWDGGGVIVEFSPIYMAKQFKNGKYEQVVMQLFKSDEWKKFDRGDLTLANLKKIVCKNYDLETDIMDELFQFFLDSLKPKNETIEIVKQLKREGYDQYYLSNGSKEYIEHVKSESYRSQHDFDFNQLFKDEDMLISAYINQSKPEPEIYQEAVKKFNLKERTVIFIDDTQVNIDEANKQGWIGILFKGVGSLLESFRDQQISVLREDKSKNMQKIF